MTEMVERMARAICTALGEEPDNMEEHCLPGSYQTDDGEPHWHGYIDHARAVLAEIRLPTREMLEAADAAGSPESPALPHEVWPAMIDAAIGKGM